MHAAIVSLMLFSAAAGQVTTSEKPDTMLYVRTTPAGAEVLLNGKPLGKTDGLFPIEPGEYKIVIDLEGHQPEEQTITIGDGRIRRIELKLKQRPAHAETAEAKADETPLSDLLNRLPDGWKLVTSRLMPPDEVVDLASCIEKEIGRRLQVGRMWDAVFSVDGERAPVAVVEFRSEAEAERVYRTLAKEGAKGAYFRLGTTVVGLVSFDFYGPRTPAAESSPAGSVQYEQPRRGAAATPATEPGEEVEIRKIDKKIADFPESVDLSTPESACAAFHRACARMDADAVVDLSWVKIDPAETKRFWAKTGSEDLKTYNKAQLDSEILEVMVYRGKLAAVISKLEFPPGVGRHPYSLRGFGRIGGQWKNMGEDRCLSLDAAEAMFRAKKDRLWAQFVASEAERKPAAVLEFRVAPVQGKDGPQGITEEEIARYREELKTQGPAAKPAAGGDFRWFPLKAKAEAKPDLITQSYDDRTYVLLGNRPQEMMSIGPDDAYDGSLTHLGTDWNVSSGKPSIRLEFDERGADRLNALSRAYLHRPVAVIVDGQVIFCPRIQSPMSSQVSITGDFSEAEVAQIVETLKTAVVQEAKQASSDK